MLGGGPLERNVCKLYTRYCESSKSLEGGCGMDRVPQCRLLKVLYHRQCQYTQANEYHFDGANSIETTNQ